jgi:hypothetical protein
MSYNLFIDPTKEPQRDGKKWQTARSTQAAAGIMKQLGAPAAISVNYDLGKNEPYGADIARWLVQLDLNHNILAEDLDLTIHGGSIVDATNMKTILRNYLKFKYKAKVTA